MTNSRGDTASYLREAHATIARNNPRYSLRAFAKKVGLSPGGLTHILARKKRLSLERAHQVATRLGLSPREAERFLLLVQIDGTENLELKSSLLDKLRDLGDADQAVHNLTVDQFRLISDWYGLAVYEYLAIPERPSDAKSIAQFLGITASEAKLTLERLKRLEFIEETTDGKFERMQDRLLIESTIPNEAIRNHYLSVLEKAEESIRVQAPQEKVIGTEVFNFDPEDLPEAMELTEDYFQKMLALSARAKRATHVYQLFVDLFRLNQPQPSSHKEKSV